MATVAERDGSKCAKDCSCVYICPTGAADTEDGKIDEDKCIGCGKCVEFCLTRALSMKITGDRKGYPPERHKAKTVRQNMYQLAEKKMQQMQIASDLHRKSTDEHEKKFLMGIGRANLVMAAGFMREGGYLQPQGDHTKALLSFLQETETDQDVTEEIEKLLKNLYNPPEEKTQLSGYKKEYSDKVKGIKVDPVLDPDLPTDLSLGQLAALFANLCKGSETQSRSDDKGCFIKLLAYYKEKYQEEIQSQSGNQYTDTDSFFADLDSLLDKELENDFSAAIQEAKKFTDRGAQRTLKWAYLASRYMQELLKEKDQALTKIKEGEKVRVYVCKMCGFLAVRDNDELLKCLVCGAPHHKFEPQLPSNDEA
ncbi:4Fe-4S binding protein [Desulfobulbus sp. TB]|nr:4Fe-4S binding protein [Desulfobulbus sp. TB]